MPQSGAQIEESSREKRVGREDDGHSEWKPVLEVGLPPSLTGAPDKAKEKPLMLTLHTLLILKIIR